MRLTTDLPLLTYLTPRGSSDPNENVASSFSPGASPPLILAFLAIGLFGLSMVGMFGWRRMQYARMGLQDNDHEWGPDERLSKKGLGPRPVLWDLRTIDEKYRYKDVAGTTRNFDQTEEHETWDTIMPVAAVVMSQPRSGNDRAATPRPDTFPYGWSQRFASTTSTTATDANAKKKGNLNAGNGNNDERRLQTVVAIAMPSQRIPLDLTGARARIGTGAGEEDGIRNDDTFEYTLGVYECAWKHDNK